MIDRIKKIERRKRSTDEGYKYCILLSTAICLRSVSAALSTVLEHCAAWGGGETIDDSLLP